MNESGQVYKYNKLRTIRTLTDIISQCIVAFAFSAFVILGLTNKSDSYCNTAYGSSGYYNLCGKKEYT